MVRHYGPTAGRLRGRLPRTAGDAQFNLTLRREARERGATAMDSAKRLLDFGYHAPTMYFPRLVPECRLIEPTETEAREVLDGFVEAMVRVRQEAEQDVERLKGAPWALPVRRLDDLRAARQPDLAWPEAS